MKEKQTVIFTGFGAVILLAAYILLQMRPTPITSDTALHADAGYAFFQDRDFPFTFEYPSDWNTVELPGSSSSYAFDGVGKDVLIGKDVTREPKSRKVGEWFIVRTGETPFPSNARPPSTTVTLDGHNYELYDVGSGLFFYLLQIGVGTDSYEIEFNGTAPATANQAFEKIISSFKFNGLYLLFDVGGSIFTNSYLVKISGSHLLYRESAQGKELQKIDRFLSPSELADIQKTISDATLVSLASQDIEKEPLSADAGTYSVFVSLNGKENSIDCGIAPPGALPATLNCQQQIGKLRLKLNQILGVTIR